MSQLLELSAKNFEAEVLKSELPVLVDFWAPWCGPCVAMAPILEDLSKELAGKVKIAKINVEEADNQELALKYHIQSIPNMKLFKGGEVVSEFVGMRTKETLAKEIQAKI